MTNQKKTELYIIGKMDKERITVLHFVSTMNRGGVESVLMNLLRYIDKDRFSFIFLCPEGGKYDYEDEIVELGAKIIRTPNTREVGLFKYLANVRRILRDERVDIAHVHNHSLAPLIAAKYAGIRSRINHSHTTGTETAPSLRKRIYISISKAVMSMLSTERIACEYEAGRYMFGSKSFHIYHNGIIVDDFKFSKDDRIRVRNELDIPKGSTVIGHIGRMSPVKNQKFIIEVYEEYLKLVPNSYLILVGEGYQRDENEQYTRKYKVSERVKFLGSRGDVGALYSAMDLFILPSINEGLGMVLIEAQVNGLRSLVSDTVPESVKLTSGVEFYPLKNGAREWASKLNSMDLSRFDAQKTIEQTSYNIELSVKVIENLYADALGRQ